MLAVVDDRVLSIHAIVKPLKFAISLALYAATLAWMLGQVQARPQRTGWIVAAAAAIEMAVIMAAVATGPLPEHGHAAQRRPVERDGRDDGGLAGHARRRAAVPPRRRPTRPNWTVPQSPRSRPSDYGPRPRRDHRHPAEPRRCADRVGRRAARRAARAVRHPAPGSTAPPPTATSSRSTCRPRSDGEAVDDLTAKGLSYQVGQGSLLDGLDEAVTGLRRGRVGATSRPRWSAATTPARRPTSPSTVKSVKERELPELDDDFAQTASEFDTLDELRADVRTRLDGHEEACSRASRPATGCSRRCSTRSTSRCPRASSRPRSTSRNHYAGPPARGRRA